MGQWCYPVGDIALGILFGLACDARLKHTQNKELLIVDGLLIESLDGIEGVKAAGGTYQVAVSGMIYPKRSQAAN